MQNCKLDTYVYSQYIQTKQSTIVSKSGCIIQVVKHLKEDWFVVLQYNEIKVA